MTSPLDRPVGRRRCLPGQGQSTLVYNLCKLSNWQSIGIYLKWEAPSRTTATEGVEVERVFAMQFALAVLVAILIASYWRVLLRILLVVGLASLLVGIVDIVSALGNN